MRLRPGELARGVLAAGAVPALGLLSGPLLARALGPEGRGELAAVLQPLSLMEWAAAVGFPAALTVFVARGVSPREALRSAAPVVAIAAVGAFCLLSAWSLVVADRYEMSLPVLVACQLFVFVGVATQLLRGVTAGQGHWKRLDAERVAIATLRLLVIGVLAAVGLSYAPAFAAGILLVGACATAVFMLPKGALRRVRSTRRASPGTAGLRRFALTGWPGSLAAMTNARLDQAVLPAFVASEALGYYAVAVTIAELPVLVTAVVSRHILTSVAASRFDGSARRLALSGLGVCTVMVVTLVLVGNRLLVLLFGADFLPAGEALRVLLLAALIGVVPQWAGAAHTGAGRPGVASVSHVIGSVVTVSGLLLVREAPTLAAVSWVAVASQAAAALFLLIHGLLTRRESGAAPPAAPPPLATVRVVLS